MQHTYKSIPVLDRILRQYPNTGVEPSYLYKMYNLRKKQFDRYTNIQQHITNTSAAEAYMIRMCKFMTKQKDN